MQDEYKPNLETSCTKDDAVQYLLGWNQGCSRLNSVPEEAHPDEEELYDFSVSTLLQDSLEAAEADYSNAIYHKLADEIIAEKLAEVEKVKSTIKTAHEYMCLIDDELAKGGNSAFRIDQNATKNSGYPYITIASLDQWAQREFDIDIFGNMPTDQEEKEDGKAVISLKITFAFLIDLLAESDTKFQNKGKANAKAIAAALVEEAKKYKTQKNGKGKTSVPGQSEESIRKRIDNAMKIRDEDF